MTGKKHYSVLLLVLAFIMLTSCQNEQPHNQKFSHHVFFWLHNPDNPDDRAEFEEGIKNLLEMPQIQSSHFGVPAETGHRDVVEASYTYSYLVFFEDKQSHDIYQEHPIHQKFIDDYQHLWKKVVVYDAVMDY